MILYLLDWHSVVMLQLPYWYRVPHIVLQDLASLSAESEVESTRLELHARYLFSAEFGDKLAHSFLLIEVPELHSSICSANSDGFKFMTEIYRCKLWRLSLKGALESAEVQVQAVDFVGCADCEEITRVRLINHVSSELGDANLEVAAILRVQLDVSV